MTPHWRKMAETWVHNGCCNFACEVYVSKQGLICTCQTQDPPPPTPTLTHRKTVSFRGGLLEALWLPLFPLEPLGVCERRGPVQTASPLWEGGRHTFHTSKHTHIHTCASLSNTYTPRLVKWLGRHDRDKSFISRWDNVLFMYLSF